MDVPVQSKRSVPSQLRGGRPSYPKAGRVYLKLQSSSVSSYFTTTTHLITPTMFKLARSRPLAAALRAAKV
jgi:hypothetical protein